MSSTIPLSAFLAPFQSPHPLRRPRPARCPLRMSNSNTLHTQERVLRLERALAAAVLQERYTDAASLRDALEAARHSDPVLSKRAELAAAVESEDFLTAARVRDELATLTEQFSRANAGRRVDRIIVLRGRAHPAAALRVATVSRDGSLQLPLDASESSNASSASNAPPTVYLQPTWSPSGDFVAITEISFNIDINRAARTVAIADSASRLVIMSAFDGTVVKSAPLRKPPFFYYWSPDGRCVTLLSNDPDAPTTTVALSAMQIVAPPGGGGGLDLEHVTGPLASGHPFLYDFCPRDTGRVVAHMGDKSAVAIVPVSRMDRFHRFLTTDAGSFGAPQWHPNAGKDGREVVLFVEQEKSNDKGEKKKDDDSFLNGVQNGELTVIVDKDLDVGDEEQEDEKKLGNFEKFLSNGSNLLESVLRKGAESLGLTSPTTPDIERADNEKPQEDEDNNVMKEERNSQSNDNDDKSIPLRQLLRKRSSTMKDRKWGDLFVSGGTTNRLVMCDAENPQLRRTIARFSGVMAFKLSPDGNTLATLVTNPSTGDDELTVCTGDFSPDSVVEKHDIYGFTSPKSEPNNTADIILSTPYTRVLAFFWSPDSKRLLFLTSLKGSRVGAAQWATFDLTSNKVVRYEKFVISGIYMHCLNFFDQFAASMTPWSPDSDAFCYPGRPLTQQELEKEQDQTAASSPALSVLFLQRDGASDEKRFSARVQQVPDTLNGDGKPEEAKTIVENVEYACWSPC